MPIPQISVDELVIAMAGDAPLYDVREPGEYDSGHVDGAIAVPLGEVAESLDKFANDRRVYVICASGARSGRAVEYLRASGIDAHNVAGGTNAWIESGRHTTPGESSS